MKLSLNRCTLAVALAAALSAASPGAHAIGALTDLTVIDRDTGATLPVYSHAGRNYVAGRPGARYAIALRNQTGARLLNVISVDGVNVVSGENAGWPQTGYVLDGGRAYQITGWRKSDQEVATFEFTSLGDSYAARTGRPANVGVIGIAVFRERPLPPPVVQAPLAPSLARERASAADSGPPANAPASPGSAAAAGSASGAAKAAERDDAAAAAGRNEASAERRAAPSPTAKLGTGHGGREASHVTRTAFERLSDRPDEIVTIWYDSRENLIAMGVIPSPLSSHWPRAQPFPQSAGYVPDPPGY